MTRCTGRTTKRRPAFTGRYRAGDTAEHWRLEYLQRSALLAQCRFHDIQAAVNAARSGYRILIMPGLYQEMPSRMQPVGSYQSGPCANDYAVTEGFSNSAPPPAGPRSNDPPVRPDRNLQVKCPNAKNLIEVVGDPRPEPDVQHPEPAECLQLCNLQLQGMGRTPADVVIQGDRKQGRRAAHRPGLGHRAAPTSRSSRARSTTSTSSRSTAFAVSDVVARYGQNYGVLSFTSRQRPVRPRHRVRQRRLGHLPGLDREGLRRRTRTRTAPAATRAGSGAGWAAIATRSRSATRNRYGNTLGYSGTAGNSTWVHDNKFHDNATGLATDSFAAGHPGMPQECCEMGAQPDLFQQQQRVRGRPPGLLHQHPVSSLPKATSSAPSSRRRSAPAC